MDAQVPWQAEMEVVTPESVSFSYEVAGIGSRFLALLIDHTLESLSFLALLIVAGELGLMEDKYFLLLAASGATLAYLGYFILFEITWAGQSPGKRLMHLRVIRDGGYGLTALESILRNLLRVVDFLPVFYGAGLITMFLSEKSRRLGDLVAGTVVIKERGASVPVTRVVARSGALTGLDPEIQSIIRGRVGSFTPEELRVMRDFIRRRGELSYAARGRLAEQLTQASLRRLPALADQARSLPGELLIEAIVAADEERRG